MNLEDELRTYITGEFLPDAQTPVTDDHDLTELLDSMHLLIMVRHLEETYSIEVSDAELSTDNFETLAKLSAFVRGKLTAASTAAASTTA